MLRGINKRIIEINDTGSEYFEKVLLFINSSNSADKNKLESEAKKLIVSYMSGDGEGGYSPGFLRYKEAGKKKLMIFFLSAAAVVLTGLILYAAVFA